MRNVCMVFVATLLASSAVAATVTGSGSMTFSCYGGLGVGMVEETLSSSNSSGSLSGNCPPGTIGAGNGVIGWSAFYGSLSASASTYWLTVAMTTAVQASFSDEITVLSPASGYLVVSGEMDAHDGTDQPTTSLGISISLNGVQDGWAYQARHGQLMTGGSAICPPGPCSSITQQFTLLVPFTAGTPMPFSGSINLQTGSNTLQGIGGDINVTLSVENSDLTPESFLLESESGYLYNAPEPSSMLTVSGVLLIGLGIAFLRRRWERNQRQQST